MRRAILLALLPTILVAACSQDRGRVYPVTLDRARHILSKTDLPPVFGSDPPSVEIQANKPSEVIWIVGRDGSELMRYIATLSDAGQGRTHIVLKLTGTKGGPAGDVEQRFAENPSVKNLYLVAMGEQIASAIEGRPMDMTNVFSALATAVRANMDNIRKSFDRAAKRSE